MTTPQTPVESDGKLEAMLIVLLEAHSDYVAELTADWGVSSKARTELANERFCGLKAAFLSELTTLRAKADAFDAAQAALVRANMGGLFDEFTSLADAIEQMSVHCARVEDWANETGLVVRAKQAEDAARLDWWFAHGLDDSVCEGSVYLWWADDEAMATRVTHGTTVRDAIDKAMRGVCDEDSPAPDPLLQEPT